jgi:hypothetical protein
MAGKQLGEGGPATFTAPGELRGMVFRFPDHIRPPFVLRNPIPIMTAAQGLW